MITVARGSGTYVIQGVGTATVTATANDGSGVVGVCHVTVTEPPAPEPVNSVRIDRTDSSYQTGVSQINLNLPRNATKPVTAQVSATVTYDSHTDHEVVWEVFDPNQAITFDQTTGLITAVGAAPPSSPPRPGRMRRKPPPSPSPSPPTG